MPPRPLVIVAEDDAALRGLLTWSLERAGYRVTEVADGLALRDRLLNGGRPAAVITDVCMPGLSGLDALAEARRQGFTGPCIVIASFPEPEVLLEAQRLEVATVLGKPFEVAALVRLLDQVLAA